MRMKLAWNMETVVAPKVYSSLIETSSILRVMHAEAHTL
jgi:hypothetical protein